MRQVSVHSIAVVMLVLFTIQTLAQPIYASPSGSAAPNAGTLGSAISGVTVDEIASRIKQNKALEKFLEDPLQDIPQEEPKTIGEQQQKEQPPAIEKNDTGALLEEALEHLFKPLDPKKIAGELEPLISNGQEIKYNPENAGPFLQALNSITIKPNAEWEEAGGVVVLSEKKDQNGSILSREILVRDTEGNIFIVFSDGSGEVQKVALRGAKDNVADGMEFRIVHDPAIGEIIQKKLTEHAQHYGWQHEAKRLKDIDIGRVGGFIFDDAIEQGKQIIRDNPLVASFFILLYQKYPGIALRDHFYLTEKCKMGAGMYDQMNNRVVQAEWEDVPFEVLYVHELTHYIYNLLQGTDSAKKINEYFKNKQTSNLALFLRTHDQYLLDSWDDSYETSTHWQLANEMLAWIAGDFLGGNVISALENYHITFGDIKLLIDVGILPADYVPQEILEAVDDSMLLPYGFHEIIELIKKEGSLDRACQSPVFSEIVETQTPSLSGLIPLIRVLVSCGQAEYAKTLVARESNRKAGTASEETDFLVQTTMVSLHLYNDLSTEEQDAICDLFEVVVQDARNWKALADVLFWQVDNTHVSGILMDHYKNESAIYEVLRPFIEYVEERLTKDPQENAGYIAVLRVLYSMCGSHEKAPMIEELIQKANETVKNNLTKELQPKNEINPLMKMMFDPTYDPNEDCLFMRNYRKLEKKYNHLKNVIEGKTNGYETYVALEADSRSDGAAEIIITPAFEGQMAATICPALTAMLAEMKSFHGALEKKGVARKHTVRIIMLLEEIYYILTGSFPLRTKLVMIRDVYNYFLELKKYMNETVEITPTPYQATRTVNIVDIDAHYIRSA